MTSQPVTPEQATQETSRRIKRLNAIYANVLELRNFETQNLNVRNSFILTINVGLFAYAAGKDLIVLPLFGMAVSLLQIHMAAGAKFWQEAWEGKLFDVERELYKIYCEENRHHPNADPFIHLFTPDPALDNGIDLERGQAAELSYCQEMQMKRRVTNRMRKRSPVSWLISRKYSVSRTPIYLGILIAVFWALLFGQGLLR